MDNHDITQSVLLAYLDNALPHHEMRALEERLQHDPALRNACQALQDQESELYALGEALRNTAPPVDVLYTVLEHIKHAPSESLSLERDLQELGQALRVQAPRVELTQVIMEQLPQRDLSPPLQRLEHELTAVGNELRRHTPRINVVPEVTAEARTQEYPTMPSLAERRRQKAAERRASPLSWRAAAAVAACAAAGIVLVLMQTIQPVATSPLNIAKRQPTPVATTPAQTKDIKPPREGESLAFNHADSSAAVTLLSNLSRPATPPEQDLQADVEVGPGNAFSIDDIIAARRQALGGESEALTLLARWGALDPDEVRRMLAAGILSPTEMAGLSRFLPEDEALALLQQALEQRPDDPALQYALARQLMEDPSRHGEAAQYLAMLKELAPDNALPHYMDAQLRMSQGDYSGALLALEYAANLTSGTAYALESARYHSAALMAAGFSTDASQLLATFNAGADEYASVNQLSYDLLSYGAYFESQGDYDTALAIYKSVHQMGLQINEGAQFTNEQLAGLDVQVAAVEAINALNSIFRIPGGAEMVNNAYALFMEGLDIFLNNAGMFEALVGGSDAQTLLHAIRHMMLRGEVNYLQQPSPGK